MDFLIETNEVVAGILKEAEGPDAKAIIKELISTSWGGDNDSQAKAVELLKGLAFSNDPAANEFMAKLDEFTASLDAGEFAESRAAIDEAFNAKEKKWLERLTGAGFEIMDVVTVGKSVSFNIDPDVWKKEGSKIEAWLDKAGYESVANKGISKDLRTKKPYISVDIIGKKQKANRMMRESISQDLPSDFY